MKKLISVLFVFLGFSILSGCGAIFNPQGRDVEYKKSGPGYHSRCHEQVDDMGRVRIRCEEEVGSASGGGYYMGPHSMSPGALDYPEAEYWSYECYETQSGQQICPSQDGVMPYVAEGDEMQPGMSPNSRRDAQIRDLQTSRDASDRQHLNNIRYLQRQKYCRKNPTKCR